MADNIMPFKGVWPTIDPSVFLAPTASVIGDVEIGAETNIWFGCLVRGDMNVIRIGKRVNIQDLTVVHVDSRKYGTFIGNQVTIGHAAVIHACTVKDRCFIGMQACVMGPGATGQDDQGGPIVGRNPGALCARLRGAGNRDDRKRAAGILGDGAGIPENRHRRGRRAVAVFRVAVEKPALKESSLTHGTYLLELYH